MWTTPLISSARVPAGICSYRSWNVAWSRRCPSTRGARVAVRTDRSVVLMDGTLLMQDMAPQTDGQLETGAAAAIFGIAGMAAGHNHLSCCKGASLLEQESVPIFAESRRKITPPPFCAAAGEAQRFRLVAGDGDQLSVISRRPGQRSKPARVAERPFFS